MHGRTNRLVSNDPKQVETLTRQYVLDSMLLMHLNL